MLLCLVNMSEEKTDSKRINRFHTLSAGRDIPPLRSCFLSFPSFPSFPSLSSSFEAEASEVHSGEVTSSNTTRHRVRKH